MTKLRDKILYMSFGAGLVVLGMVLNVLVADADAGKGSLDAKFDEITCRKITIKDGNETRAVFGLDRTDIASLSIFDKGDGSHHRLVYLGSERIYEEDVYDEDKIVSKKKYVARGDTRLDLFSEYNPKPYNPKWYSIDQAIKELDLPRSKFFEMIEKGELLTNKRDRKKGEPEMVQINDPRDNRSLSLRVNFNGGRIDATDRTGGGGYRIGIGSEGEGQLWGVLK